MSLSTPRPRSTSRGSERSKRRRIDDDDDVLRRADHDDDILRRNDHDDDYVLPEQSASQSGSSNPLALHEKNTFSLPAGQPSAGQPSAGQPSAGQPSAGQPSAGRPPAGQPSAGHPSAGHPFAGHPFANPRRPSSLTRETPIILRSAWPPVVTESLNGLRGVPPAYVEQLGDRLAEGLDVGFIPRRLQEIILADARVGYQTFRQTDFYDSDKYSMEELHALWEAIRGIFLNARDCKDGNRDENAWCDDVLRPLIYLAIQSFGRGRWWFQNVQNQSINPAYLSITPDPTPKDPTRSKLIDCKNDCVLSYSHRDRSTARLYRRLAAANIGEISHSADSFTKRTALFAGFAVKPAYGSLHDAELQTSIWMAASLRKKMDLARAAQVYLDPPAIAEPALAIVGHDHHVYYTYPEDYLVDDRPGIHVLGPDTDRFENLTTDSIRGIFRLHRFYGNLLQYGMDDDDEGYWGGFFGLVLDRLAPPLGSRQFV